MATPTPPPQDPVDLLAQQIQATMQHGLALHQAGRLQEAEAMFLEVLRYQPMHGDCLHMLGIIAAQTRRFPRALGLIGRAIMAQPHNAAYHSNLGNVLKESNQFAAALASYDQAIALMPDFADAHYNRGIILQEFGRLDEALASFDRAIEIRPDYAQAYSNRGIVLKDLKRCEAALASFDQAITLNPRCVEAYSNRGATLMMLDRVAAAVDSLDHAIALKPDYADAYNNRGSALQALKQYEAALASYDSAIALKPDYSEAYSNRALCLKELKRFAAALASCDQAIALKPDNAEAHLHRGVVLQELWRFEDALACYDRSLALKADNPEAHYNRGLTLQKLKRLHAAIQEYDHAIAMRPGYVDAHWNKAILLLLAGDLRAGFALYEWRWLLSGYERNKPKYKQPVWLGEEPIGGKTVVLYAEQGLGDTIQFCRYAKMLADLGARVIMAVPAALLGLLNGLEGVSAWIRADAPPPEFDYYTPLLSMPLVFKTDVQSIPAAPAYLHSAPDKVAQWHEVLGAQTKPRVGLVWRGSVTHQDDHNRSIALEKLLPYLPDSCEYISLHNELREADRACLGENPQIRYYGEQLQDFCDTAALCDLMDVVISVDTSVAHLAGALGKETWIMLPYFPDWRWLLDTSDSAWYPSVKLYRQESMGDWSAVLEQIQHDLAQLALGGS